MYINYLTVLMCILQLLTSLFLSSAVTKAKILIVAFFYIGICK